MSINHQADWGQQAYEHARQVTEVDFGRGSATEAEAKAARYVEDQLADFGIQDVRLQPFEGLRSIWFFMALAFGFVVVGHLAFWVLRPPVGDLGAALLSLPWFAFGGYLLWRKLTFRDYPLRSSLPHGPSQNVLAVLPASGETRQKVVLTGHLDSHRAVIWFIHDWLVKFYALSNPVAMIGVVLAPAIYLLAAITGWLPLAWICLPLALTHFLVWFTGITADMGLYSPGANDNASAVGTVLALARRLQQEPLANTEVWLAFTGCEETGCDGMIELLKAHGDALRDAMFINFELVGIGERLVYLQDEGMLRKQRIDPQVEALVQQVGTAFDLQPMNAAKVGAFTETGTVWEYGFKGVCFMAQRADSALLPEWHRLTDTADHLQPEMLGQVHELAWAMLRTLDQKSSGG